MKVVATICSRRKREDADLLPAKERYTGTHIGAVAKEAALKELPLYFLSGKYGLISGDEKIPYYDYYLELKQIEPLVKIVGDQLQKAGITLIDFYIEEKESWQPYIKTLKTAADSAAVTVNIKPLS